MTATGLRRLALLILVAGSLPCRGVGAADENAVTIHYIAHASFVLTGPGGTRLLLDPYADRVWLGYDFPANIQADAVFSTHPHYDHDGGLFIGRTPEWKGRMPLYSEPGVVRLGGFVVHGFKGRHAPPYGKEFGYKNTVFVFQAAGLTLVHIGDNEALKAGLAEKIGHADILMLPIDGNAHLLSFAAIDAYANAIQPRILIPMHYRIGDLEPDPEKPKGLGGIDPWLATQRHVIHLSGNTATLRKQTLPAERQIWVFAHAPELHPPHRAPNSPAGPSMTHHGEAR